jgi:hypothetical protein
VVIPPELVNWRWTPSTVLTSCIDVIRHVPTRQGSSDGFADADAARDADAAGLIDSPPARAGLPPEDATTDSRPAGRGS